ncbi:class I SAM-dependent methyltransferase [Desulfonatronum parangueonense]
MPLTIRMLKRLLKPISRTPLHPQWLLSFGLPDKRDWLRQHARGLMLDIGCGDAWLRRALFNEVQYIGLDYPTTMALGYSGRPDIMADATMLPIASESVGTVVLINVLEHIAQPEKTIAEAARVLKPAGKCLLQVPFLYPMHDEPHDYHRWTRYGLLRLLEENSFNVEEIKHSSSPYAAAATLCSMALAKSIFDGLRQKSPIVLAAPLIFSLIPAVNLCGWGMSKILPNSPIMPCSYMVVAVKNIGV